VIPEPLPEGFALFYTTADYDGAIVPDPEGIITSGHDNKTARCVAIRQNEEFNKAALLAMFKQIIANNRAGGWRKLKQRS